MSDRHSTLTLAGFVLRQMNELADRLPMAKDQAELSVMKKEAKELGQKWARVMEELKAQWSTKPLATWASQFLPQFRCLRRPGPLGS